MVVDEVFEKLISYGYDVNYGEYVDMFKVGVIDLVKVVCIVLVNVGSIVGLLLIMDVMVLNFDDEDKKKICVEGVIV